MLLRIYDGQCAFFSFRMSEVLQKKATNECKIEGDLVGTYSIRFGYLATNNAQLVVSIFSVLHSQCIYDSPVPSVCRSLLLLSVPFKEQSIYGRLDFKLNWHSAPKKAEHNLPRLPIAKIMDFTWSQVRRKKGRRWWLCWSSLTHITCIASL